MTLKEADLYPAVKKWLEGQGLNVYPEVPIMHRPVDVVGIGETVSIGVEMKRHLSRKVCYQASTLALCCDRSYVAIGSKPRSIERPKQMGVGVLRVVGDTVEVLLESAHTITPSEHYYKQLREKCSHMTGEGCGGVPCLDGVGPARDCRRRVDEYLKAHPGAKWKEIYENVPNHYASFHSMQGALTTKLQMRDFFKKLRREQAAEKRKASKGRGKK